MSMNPNWPRWIWASTSKLFNDAISLSNLQVYVEGDDRPQKPVADFCEFRMDGPYGKQQSPIDWELEIEVNIAITSINDEKDTHKIHRNNGIVAAAFPVAIPIYRYGDGPDDNPAIQEGCLILRSDKREAVLVSNFGLIETEVKVLQSTVEGHYKGFFST